MRGSRVYHSVNWLAITAVLRRRAPTRYLPRMQDQQPEWEIPDLPDHGGDVGVTIAPRPVRWEQSPISSLPLIRTGDGGEPVELRLSDTLGEGGMAVVRGAMQVSLGREVAVKTLRRAGGTEVEQRVLLQEAWVTGALEHPNIVPIHTLGRTSDGEPLIVMKRVEGRTWRELIDEKGRGTQWHLDILTHVCRALEYAHDRGIIHRDVKPSNVMVGGYGEVYLLDWGIAVSLRSADEGRVPLAVDAKEIAGTPRYMAPEMTVAGTEVDERTDVYVLGAVLHEILTGGALHDGNNIVAVMLSAYASEPFDYGEEVPPGLATICAKAVRRDPATRFTSVAEFRRALEQYAERRPSHDLAAKSQNMLELLRDAVQADPTKTVAQSAVRDLFGQCHFGFEHALAIWAGNANASVGLAAAQEMMARWELASENPTSAAALLARLEDPPEELLDRLARLEREQKDAQQELAVLRRDRDLSIAARARFRLGVAVAVVFSIYPFVVAALIKSGRMEHPNGIRSVVLSFTLILFVAGLKRFGASLWDNEINRRIVSVIMATAIALPVIRLSGVLRGVHVMDVLGFEFAVFGVAAAFVAVLTNRMMYGAAAAFFAGGIVSAAFPDYTLEVFGITNAIVGTLMAFALRPMK